MKYKQGVLLVAADAACQKSAGMSQYNICYSFHCAAYVFCACLMPPKEKGKGVTVDIWWTQEQIIDYGFGFLWLDWLCKSVFFSAWKLNRWIFRHILDNSLCGFVEAQDSSSRSAESRITNVNHLDQLAYFSDYLS